MTISSGDWLAIMAVLPSEGTHDRYCLCACVRLERWKRSSSLSTCPPPPPCTFHASETSAVLSSPSALNTFTDVLIDHPECATKPDQYSWNSLTIVISTTKFSGAPRVGLLSVCRFSSEVHATSDPRLVIGGDRTHLRGT
jgi:hypothetical protein